MPSTVILDPTAEQQEAVDRQLAVRSFEDTKTIGLLDISKPRGSVLLDRLQTRLELDFPDKLVRRYEKPTMARLAPPELIAEIVEECDFVVEALAD